MILEIKDLSFSYDETEILKNITFSVEEGEFLSIMGPNGSGKSTLIKAILGMTAHGKTQGTILLKGKAVQVYSLNDLAKEVAVVFQTSHPEFDFSVEEIVEMGRYPYLGRFQSIDKHHLKMVEKAMKETGVYEFRKRSYREISGGEFQRVMIARAICQNPQILILDEPVNHLDMRYCYEILNLLKKINKEQGVTILTILHDVNIAARFSDTILFLKNGIAYKKGSPKEVISSESIYDIYEMKTDIKHLDNGNIPYIIPRF